MKWTKPGEEFDSLSKIICDPGNQYYLWGAGVFGKSTYEQLNGEIAIIVESALVVSCWYRT